MQDGKRGAGHIGAASQTRDETFDEHSFAASQVALESQDRSCLEVFGKLAPNRLRLSWTVGNERSHGAEVDGPWLRVEIGSQFGSVADLGIFLPSVAAIESDRAVK
jgi:hypothetical protein